MADHTIHIKLDAEEDNRLKQMLEAAKAEWDAPFENLADELGDSINALKQKLSNSSSAPITPNPASGPGQSNPSLPTPPIPPLLPPGSAGAGAGSGGGLAPLLSGAGAGLAVLAGATAGAVTAGLLIAFDGLKFAVEATRDALEELGRRITDYSPAASVAAAQAEIRQLNNDIALARRIGANLADFTEAQSKLQISLDNLKGDLIELFEPFITWLIESITQIIDFFREILVWLNLIDPQAKNDDIDRLEAHINRMFTDLVGGGK